MVTCELRPGPGPGAEHRRLPHVREEIQRGRFGGFQFRGFHRRRDSRTRGAVWGDPDCKKINVSLVWAIREAECGGWEILTRACSCSANSTKPIPRDFGFPASSCRFGSNRSLACSTRGVCFVARCVTASKNTFFSAFWSISSGTFLTCKRVCFCERKGSVL